MATFRLAKDGRESSQKQIAAWEKTTADQIKTWEKNSLDQIGVQTWLALEARFDSLGMKRARRMTAYALASYNQTFKETHTHPPQANIPDGVFELFESVGTLYNLGMINKQLAESTFSFYAAHWWEAAKAYIAHERMKQGDDPTLFYDFEAFAKAMREKYKAIKENDLNRFLQDEKALDGG